jgi:hypothetical protein
LADTALNVVPSCVSAKLRASVAALLNRFVQPARRWRWSDVEPMTGIEPAYSAWEADVLPLNYIGMVVSEG